MRGRRAGKLRKALEREGLTCVEFNQNDARMIPASARLHAAIVEQRRTLPDDPEFARHASDATACHSRRGWRIDKARKETNIDAMIAAGDGDRARRDQTLAGGTGRMALKPCLRCGVLTNAGSYCQRHQPRNGSTRQWRSARERIMARDLYTCQQCGAPAQHGDHIVPFIHGGRDDPSNLRALCGPCNLRKGDR